MSLYWRRGARVIAVVLAALALAAAWAALPQAAWAGEAEGRVYAVRDAEGTLFFIRSHDEVDVGPNKTVTATVTSVEGEAYTGIVYDVDEETGAHPWTERDDALNKLRAVVFRTTVRPVSVRLWFKGCGALKTCDLTGLDTSRCTSMASMFQSCTRLRHVNLSGIDTSAVTDMSMMFYRCLELESLDLSGFDTSRVTKMPRMFELCLSLTGLDLSGFDTSAATDMARMFASCQKLESLDVSSFDMSAVKTCSDLFSGCWSLARVSLSPGFSFKAPSASSEAAALPGSADLGRWTREDGAFGPMTAAELAESYDGASMAGMWLRERGYAVIDPSGAMTFFRAASTMPSGGAGTLSGRDGAVYEGTFYTGFEVDKYALTFGGERPPWLDRAGEVVSVRFADKVRPASTALWFYKMSSCADFDLAGLDTSAVTDMSRMFMGCSSLAALDVSALDTSLMRSADYLFSGCSSLAAIDVSGLDLSNASKLNGMFSGCSSLVSFDASGVRLSAVENADDMFRGCSSLVWADLSGMDSTRVRSLAGLFFECPVLTSVDISGIAVTSYAQYLNMFYKNPSLSSIKVGKGFSFTLKQSWTRYGLCSFPQPPSGKWVRDDLLFGPYTPLELQQSYSSEMAGTWVWAKASYTVSFDAQGGQGSMARLSCELDEPLSLPACSLYRLGRSFLGWALEPGGAVAYEDGASVPAGTYGAWQDVVLYAVWGEAMGAAEVADGELQIELRAGEEASLELPAGTSYQVWEELPAGWALVARSGASGTLLPGAEAKASFTNSFRPGTASVCLAGTKALDGAPPKAGAWWFQLVDGSGSVVQAVTCGSGGGFAFAPLSFSEPGEWRYVVREAPGDDPAIEYDASEFGVTVVVEAGAEGALTARAVWDAGTPAFENRTRPGSLTVSKAVVGTQDCGTEFQIAVDLGGGDIRRLALRAGESATIEGIPAGTRYEVSEPELPSGYSLLSSEGAAGVIQAGRESSASFTNAYAASGTAVVTARKTMDGAAPEGRSFEFGLFDESGALAASAQSTSTGDVVFPQIELTSPGTYRYTMRELVPEGGGDSRVVYDLSEHTAVVEAADAGGGRLACSVGYLGPSGEPEETPVFANRSAPGSVLVVKTDAETGEPVPGAVYELRPDSGEAIGRAATSGDGSALFEEVAPGAYELVEVEVPVGYALSEEAVAVTVEPGGQARAACEDRRARGGARVRKTDLAGNALAGAEFVISDEGGAVWARIVSGADGVAETSADALPCGAYTVRESAAPRGYRQNEEWLLEFAVEEDGAVVDLTGAPCEDAAANPAVLPRSGGSAARLTAATAAGALLAATGLAASSRLGARRREAGR